MRTFSIVLASTGVLSLAAVAAAEDDPSRPSPSAAPSPVSFAVAAGTSDRGPEATGQVELRVGSRTRLGMDVGFAYGEWFPRGVAVDDVITATARARWRRHLAGRGQHRFELMVAAGASRHSGDSPLWVVAGEIEAVSSVRLRDALRLRLGLALPLAFSTDDGAPERIDPLSRLGVDIGLARGIWLTADAEVGSAFGYDGDGDKFRAAASVGIKVDHDDGDRFAAQPHGGSGAFVSAEWRALGIAGHASHGPGFAAGVRLLDGRLAVGLAGFGRPGPINPRTFATTPVDGQEWRGQTRVPLRSDGSFVGLHVAPALRFGRVRVEAPVTFGQVGFGFYLAGADRDAVPEGTRVSTVENQLFGGRDSSIVLGVEVGLGVSWQATSWLAPHVAVHWLTSIGYDTIVTDDYGGPSIAVGVTATP